jgi:hypothetical protein
MINETVELIYILSCITPFIELEEFGYAYGIKWKKDWIHNYKEIINKYLESNIIEDKGKAVSLIDSALTIVETFYAKNKWQIDLKKYIIDNSRNIINNYVTSHRNIIL